MNQELERKAVPGNANLRGGGREKWRSEDGRAPIGILPPRLSLEHRSLAYALLASLLSLASAWLAAIPIEKASAPPAQPAPAIASSPAPLSPQQFAQGAQLFAQSCGDCHGDDGHGDEGPDLHNLSISNARIARQIKNGEKGEMPSFAKKYNDRQVALLVAYVRSLR